ncbi:MAG: hypothetical protein ABI623_07400 [bacterium]
MKRILAGLLLFSIAQVWSQTKADADADVVSQRGSLRLMPLYQNWSLDSVKVSETSVLLSLYQPLSSRAAITLRGAFASANGDVTSLSGTTDLQVAGSYYVESAHMMFSLGLGIPVGKKNMKTDEFVTSILLANNTLRFNVSQFGTGFNVTPGVVWALPVSDDVVLGLGATYQYRGTFQPLEDLGTFDPGDEVSGTAGVELRLSETSSISADFVYTHIGKDLLDGDEIYVSGGKIFAAVQFRKYFEFNSLFIGATFRSKAKSEVALGKFLAPRFEPNQAEILGVYTARLSDAFSLGFAVEGRFFQETSIPFSGFNLIGVGLMPEFSVSESVSIPLRVKFTSGKGKGNITGFEAGVGISIGY